MRTCICRSAGADYWKEARCRFANLGDNFENIRDALDRSFFSRRRKVRARCSKRELKAWIDDLDKQIREVIEDKEQFGLLIGFCLGLMAYKKELKSELNRVRLNVIEKFTIKKPTIVAAKSREP
jgi:hypothetical protein